MMIDETIPLEHLLGDSLTCEVGQGIIGITALNMEMMHMRLELGSGGHLQERSGFFDATVDLPPGCCAKPMSCMCMPVIYKPRGKVQQESAAPESGVPLLTRVKTSVAKRLPVYDPGSPDTKAIIGVLQFLNKVNLWGKTQAFSRKEQAIAESFAEMLADYYHHPNLPTQQQQDISRDETVDIEVAKEGEPAKESNSKGGDSKEDESARRNT